MGGRGAALMYVRINIDYDPTAAKGGGAGAVSDLHSGPSSHVTDGLSSTLLIL